MALHGNAYKNGVVTVGNNETTPLRPDSLLCEITKASESRISEINALTSGDGCTRHPSEETTCGRGRRRRRSKSVSFRLSWLTSHGNCTRAVSWNTRPRATSHQSRYATHGAIPEVGVDKTPARARSPEP
ncbi:hypothetical protein LSAT2_000196 [Lamellibrachia satsuma]|nr:hypothetical protein LSAT2_000196 [Lamellibrachia satsuma]